MIYFRPCKYIIRGKYVYIRNIHFSFSSTFFGPNNLKFYSFSLFLYLFPPHFFRVIFFIIQTKHKLRNTADATFFSDKNVADFGICLKNNQRSFCPMPMVQYLKSSMAVGLLKAINK